METLIKFDVTNERNLTMLVDFYELTMANGIFTSDMKDNITYFDMFFRRVPDNGGFAIMAGLEQMIEYINNLHFSEEDVEYLEYFLPKQVPKNLNGTLHLFLPLLPLEDSESVHDLEYLHL